MNLLAYDHTMTDTLKTLGLIVILAAGVYIMLGFTDVVPEKAKQNSLLIHAPAKVAPGMSLHTVRRTSSAWLVDSNGEVHHKWNIKKYVPTESKYTLRKSPLQHIEAGPDGRLLAVVKDSAIVQLDSNSELIAVTEGHFHHDIDVLHDGTIVTLERQAQEVSYQNTTGVLLNDHIVFINPDGSRKAEYPLFKLFETNFSQELIEKAFVFSATAKPEDIKNDTPADVLHTNAVEILRSDLPGIAPAGSALVSFRHIDLIAIIDLEAQIVLWQYGPGELSSQHAPTVLENDHILIFDNGRKNKSSRVIELNPDTKEIVWQFDVNDYDEPEFYSPSRGSAQRLANGNTLIAMGEKGIAIEVTPNKEIVWKYKPQVRIKRPNGEIRTVRSMSLYRIFKIEDATTLLTLTGNSKA